MIKGDLVLLSCIINHRSTESLKSVRQTWKCKLLTEKKGLKQNSFRDPCFPQCRMNGKYVKP